MEATNNIDKYNNSSQQKLLINIISDYNQTVKEILLLLLILLLIKLQPTLLAPSRHENISTPETFSEFKNLLFTWHIRP